MHARTLRKGRNELCRGASFLCEKNICACRGEKLQFPQETRKRGERMDGRPSGKETGASLPLFFLRRLVIRGLETQKRVPRSTRGSWPFFFVSKRGGRTLLLNKKGI